MMVLGGLLVQIVVLLCIAAVFWAWGYLVGIKTAQRSMRPRAPQQPPSSWRGS